MSLIIINQYYAPFHAATGQLIQELAEYLVSKGKRVTVITGKNGEYDLKDEEIINEVQVIRIKNRKDGIKRIKKFLSYATFYFRLKKRLKKIVEDGSIVLAMSTPPYIARIPLTLKKKRNVKLIYNVQDLYPEILLALGKMKENNIIYRFLHKIAEMIVKGADRVIPIDESMKEILENNYKPLKNRITVIENWALKELGPNGFQKKSSKKLTILYSGNMGRAHEYETLLKAIKGSEKSEMDFIISGGGYNYNQLKREVEDFPNVIFQDFVSKEKLPDLINKADICLVIGNKNLSGIVVPSKFYGYIACQKPVIYINSGEDIISKHINNGNLGYKINNGDSKKLIDMLRKLARNKDEIRKIQKNVAIYSEKLNRNNSLERYYDLICKMEESI
ncbi:MAG: glycosyltransferase family 4 protein [Kosmotoga sp.]|nr:MAG: glycosyltransferase family 4 protein [Kosmotoga sp.]